MSPNTPGWSTSDGRPPLTVGDYNNDGFEDLFITYWGHNILYRNNGDGTFTDVTRAAGLYREGTLWGSGCTFVDYDRDGNLDLFVGHYLESRPCKTPSRSLARLQLHCKGRSRDLAVRAVLPAGSLRCCFIIMATVLHRCERVIRHRRRVPEATP